MAPAQGRRPYPHRPHAQRHGEPGYRFAPETRKLYERLIERRYPQRIYEVDAWRIPWMDCRFRLPDGRWEYHMLAVNDDSWVPVKRRT